MSHGGFFTESNNFQDKKKKKNKKGEFRKRKWKRIRKAEAS